MMEFDPRYIDVIIDRWQKFTGETAVLVDTCDNL
jgi:site-specific DNA-methyltransferase (adenine-specific)